MTFEDLNKFILFGASLCLGAFLGLLRSKLMATNEKNNFPLYFYSFSILVAAGTTIALACNWKKIITPNWFAIITYVLAYGGSILLSWFTKKYLVKKDRFLTSELDPIINSFTGVADNSEIKLVCGDMDFFGKSPSEIDTNNQYNYLKGKQFGAILILCREPVSAEQKLRYGKILAELNNVQIKFYKPKQADLNVRGRIAKVNGVDKLLIYKKLGNGYYQTIETDTANSSGALYNNIWSLVWDHLADDMTLAQQNAFINLYKIA